MKLTLKIVPDEYTENPRTDFDNTAKMVCFHKRYNLGDEHSVSHDDFNNWDEMEAHLIKELGAAVILPLYLYDHSGITISTTPFSCRWDSGQVGFIYMDRETILKEAPGNPKLLTKKAKDWATQCMIGEVKTYDQFLTGDVYGYAIEDEDGEVVDSCWGFYGEDYCRQEGEATLAYLTEQKVAA